MTNHTLKLQTAEHSWVRLDKCIAGCDEAVPNRSLRLALTQALNWNPVSKSESQHFMPVCVVLYCHTPMCKSVRDVATCFFFTKWSAHSTSTQKAADSVRLRSDIQGSHITIFTSEIKITFVPTLGAVLFHTHEMGYTLGLHHRIEGSDMGWNFKLWLNWDNSRWESQPREKVAVIHLKIHGPCWVLITEKDLH